MSIIRELSAAAITDAVERLCIEANTQLPADVKAALDKAVLWGNGCADIGQRDPVYLVVCDSTSFPLTKVICTLGWIPFLLLCGVFCALLVLVGLRCVKRCRSTGGT